MIEATNISKCFNNHEIFKSLNVNIEENSLTIITGESGKGKTTLLNVLSLIERPDSGTVKVRKSRAQSTFVSTRGFFRIH